MSETDIRTAVKGLSDTVATRLRKHHVKCFGVKVDIKDVSLKTISRQTQLDNPTNLAEVIAETSLRIIGRSWPEGKPIRLLTITGINLCDENQAQQLSLFASENIAEEKTEKAERAMDSIRSRFGSDIINFGSVLNNDIGISVGAPLKKEKE